MLPSGHWHFKTSKLTMTLYPGAVQSRASVSLEFGSHGMRSQRGLPRSSRRLRLWTELPLLSCIMRDPKAYIQTPLSVECLEKPLWVLLGVDEPYCLGESAV